MRGVSDILPEVKLIYLVGRQYTFMVEIDAGKGKTLC
jgi:hypothetical protein